jgi:Holliday junction resolvase RusA-like endonuclease
MNQRLHRMQEAKLTAMVRQAAANAFATFPPSQRVDVTMTWEVADRRRRDAENPVATLKALCDGLVDAGIVPDDTPEYMVKHMPVIRYEKGSTPAVRLEVRQIP